tara:strand:- start:1868 stop:2290 length:423 start_codon:yes stop_codon:yes gene_type:complete
MNKAKKILIMGLPGSGKTYLANILHKIIDAVWINADKVRTEANDWDFSLEGRKRQANRMKNLANIALKKNKHVIADFVCPTPKTRSDFGADFIIWMDTIKEGRFDDTNKMFVKPTKFDFRVKEKNAELISIQIAKKIKGV